MSEAQMNMTSGTPAVTRLLDAGRSLWLAGLGAVAEVEEGTLNLFDHLIKKGRPVERRQKKAAKALAEKAKDTAQGLSQLVQDTVEYESRQMLKRFNVMTREDVKILSARLETLSKKLDEYAARRTAAAIEIVSPEGEAAAIVIPEMTPETTTIAAKARTAKPRQRKTAR
jgi:poly(hydroxyalkanoate) granule-associated protein